MKYRHPWQLKKSKSWEPFWSYQLNSTANLAHLPQNWAKLAKSAVLFKGQLISKCPFGFIVWTKIPTKLFLDFCPEFFCSFLGASWKLFGLPGDLVCNIINKEACRKPQKASRKPPGRYKKFQGRNSEIISLVILSKR
jgi:hypothetical protein